MDTIAQSPSVADRLNDPQTAAALHRLLDRAEAVDKMLEGIEQLPNLLAIAVDFFDAISRKASQDGIDIEQRASGLLNLLVQVTEPRNMQALENLASRLPKLEEGSALLDELPNLFATAMDVFDEWAARLKADGIELEVSLRQGLNTALWLGCHIRQEELDRLGFLLRSNVMNEHSVEAVGIAGTALASCHRGSCEHPVPKRIGLLGMLSAVRDPNTQRAIAFGVQFAKCFGHTLTEEHDPVYHPSKHTSGETS